MKKQMFLAALTLCGAIMANGQVTLTKDWSLNCPLAAANGRSGVGTNGKFYVIQQNSGVHVYDKNGEVKKIDNSTAWVSINCDDAGHVYFRNDKSGWAGPAGDGSYTQANAQFCVYDAVADEMVAENVPMVGAWDGARFDALPHVRGNMATSPFNFVLPLQGVRVMYEFAFENLNNACKSHYSEAPVAYYDKGGLKTPNSTTAITQQYDDKHLAGIFNANTGEYYGNGKANTIGIYEKTAAGAYSFLGYADTPNHSGVGGFHIFDYKGHKFIVYPTGQAAGQNASADGFGVMELAIVDSPANTDSTPLALHYADIEVGETFPRYFNVEPVEGQNGKFSIYLYSPGKLMTVYTLDLSALYPDPKPEYTNWYVNVSGGFNNWGDNGIQPNEEGITKHEGVAIGNTEFKIKIWDGSKDIYYGYNGQLPVGEEVALSTSGSNMTIAGAKADSKYDVVYNVVDNKIKVTEVAGDPEPKPDYTTWYVNVRGEFNNWGNNGLQPNAEGICEHKDLAIGAGQFQIKVWNGADHFYGKGNEAIATGEWVELTENNQNLTIAGAAAESTYDVKYDVANNKIYVTEAGAVEPVYTYELFGNFTSDDWTPIALEETEGVWKSEKITLDKNCNFGIRKMNGSAQVAWYGQGGVAEIDKSGDYLCADTDQNFSIVAGTYEFAFTPSTLTLCVDMETPEEPEPVYEYTLKTAWRTDMRSTNSSHMRQAVGVNGKVYVTNCQYYAWDNNQPGWLEVWDENGFVEKIVAADGTDISGTNITRDEAGNILVRKSSFPNAFLGTGNFEAIIIDPEGNQTPITFDAAKFTVDGCNNNRQDFWGHMKGNMLSDEGGYLTFGSNESGHTDIKIVNGKHVGAETSRNSYWADPDLPHTSTTIFHSYSWMQDEILYQAGPNAPIKYLKREPINGTYKWFVRGEYNTPDHNNTIGCALFQIDGITYIVYSRGGNNADGIVIAKARVKSSAAAPARAATDDPDVIKFTYAEMEGDNTKYNGGQYNHFNVEMSEDGKTAKIYQYCPGNFAAMHEFTARITTGVEDVMIGEEANDAVDAAPVYYNLQGVRVANPDHGFYIKVCGNKVTKIIK